MRLPIFRRCHWIATPLFLIGFLLLYKISTSVQILDDFPLNISDKSYQTENTQNVNYHSVRKKENLTVLILTYPRCGSSLLGELVSISNTSCYIFEPFHSVKRVYKWKGYIAPEAQNTDRLLTDLLLQRKKALEVIIRDKFIAKMSKLDYCGRSDTVVIKMIRLSADNLYHLLKSGNLPTHIKILHLTRDPRGVISSFRRVEKPKTWYELYRPGNETIICDIMRKNIKTLTNLKSSGILHYKNFLEVEYENFVQNYDTETIRIFNFLNRDLLQDEVERIDKHFQVNKPGYLQTYKGVGHNINSWRRLLPMEERTLIEHKCRDLLTQPPDYEEEEVDEDDYNE